MKYAQIEREHYQYEAQECEIEPPVVSKLKVNRHVYLIKPLLRQPRQPFSYP